MAHLLRPEGSGVDSCDICGKNSKQHKIHDREKCVCIHGDAKVLEVVNRDLKIAKGSISATVPTAAGIYAGSRLAYTKYSPGRVAAGKSAAKIGQKSAQAIAVAGGAMTVVGGILDIVDAATAKLPQERCSVCNKTLQSPGCIQFCTNCRSQCIDGDWRKGSTDGKCCYHICYECFGRLVGN